MLHVASQPQLEFESYLQLLLSAGSAYDCNALGWIPPNQALTGQTHHDISKVLHFSLYEPVYYHPYSDAFP